jgi:YgiT-type zinc finger domain-containing protein
MIQITESQRCSVCGGRLRRDKITYTQTIGDMVYIVSDVEAEVCPQCGEQHLSPATVDKIQELIESGQATETRQVPVYRLPQPAP